MYSNMPYMPNMPTYQQYTPNNNAYSQYMQNTSMYQPQNYNNQQSQKQFQNSTPAIYLNSIQQAKDLSLNPNEKVFAIIQSEPVIAMIEADGMGLISRRFFNLIEFNPDVQQNNSQNSYITREEFEPFRQFMIKLQNNINSERKDIRNETEQSINE